MSRERLFEIEEESADGGYSYCWVEHRKDGYYLYGNELGKMEGPCRTVLDAVTGSGHQFGTDCMTIRSSVEAAELRAILESPSFILSNVSTMRVNGQEVKNISVEKIMRAAHHPGTCPGSP